MYEVITQELFSLAEWVKTDGIDISTIPVRELVSVCGHVAQSAGISEQRVERSLIHLLDMATQTGDKKALSALLELMAFQLEIGDKMTSYGELATKYSHILFERIPEYNYLRNRLRNELYYREHERTERQPFQGRGCIYTVLTGAYDNLSPITDFAGDWDCLVFTDEKELKCDGWELRYISDERGMGARRLSRHPKILPYSYLEDYDYCIYIDANIRITGDIKDYITRFSTGESLLCFNHHYNTDIYEETELCIELGKANAEEIREQVKRYQREGFPKQWGLTYNGFLIRNLRDPSLRKVMEDWWEEFCGGVERDQISLPYCLWKNNVKYDTSPISSVDNPYFEICEHGGKNERQ